jgi:hypothetical protein
MPNKPTRADRILASFASVIEPQSRIIDIGAGKGLLARAMSQKLDSKVTMVDVASYNKTSSPLTLCDSRALAFADHSFDYAILSFVLHHTQRPDFILNEALRVASAVIVIENDVRGSLRAALTRAIDSWPAIRYGTPPCYVAQSEEKWLQVFAKFPVKLRVLSRFTLELGFFRNVAVLLTKLK